jgi:hypothetical protein
LSLSVSYTKVPSFLVKPSKVALAAFGKVILDVLEAVPPSISLLVKT